MPVSIDTVYQRVLAIANKEQRGYITPLEFNLLANQAQLEIFEQYFYDLDQFKRKQNIPSPAQESDLTSFSDMTELIKSKLTPFTTIQTLLFGATRYPGNYKTGKIYANTVLGVYEVKLTTINEVRNILGSPFHRQALQQNPVYTESTVPGNDVIVYDGSVGTGIMTSGVTCEIITEPIPVAWGYNVIGEKALYNAGISTDFTLHDSEEAELVFKILGLAGVTINKPGLTSIAMAKETGKIQQEKI
jgi:hypothetical protein